MKVGDMYIMDLDEEVEKFKFYHRQYALETIPGEQHDRYVAMTLEQMLSHFETSSTAVQFFVLHYTTLMTQQISLGFQYHPLHFIHRMPDDKLERYVHCLWGFAEGVYTKLVDSGMYHDNGKLRADFERFEYNQLHLVIRPEVPDVFHL